LLRQRRGLIFSLGQRPRINETKNAVSAESAIHFDGQFDASLRYASIARLSHRSHHLLPKKYRDVLRKHGVDFDECYVRD
jgi:hypothetical protein